MQPCPGYQEWLQREGGGMMLWNVAMGTKLKNQTLNSVALPSRKLKGFYIIGNLKYEI